jgi:hypothetical protein
MRTPKSLGEYVLKYRPVQRPPINHEKVVKPTNDVYVFHPPLKNDIETSSHF